MALLDPDRLFPIEPARARPRPGAPCRGPRPADRQPPRPHRSALVSPRTPPSPTRPSSSSSPTTTSSACSARRACRCASLGVPRVDGGPVETDAARDLAPLRRELPPAPRHALAAVARLHLRKRLRPRHPPLRGDGRRHLRRHRRLPRPPGVPPPRALRALQHRGDRHDRERPRRPALAPDDPRLRLVRQGRHRLPARLGRRPRLRGLRRQPRHASARSPAATPAPSPATSTPTAPAAPSSSSTARRASDHGHPTARTENLSAQEAAALFDRVRTGKAQRRRGGRLPRPDADRDGADEPRRRPRPPDPRRARSATTRPRSTPPSAATRASTSRRAPTSSAR